MLAANNYSNFINTFFTKQFAANHPFTQKLYIPIVGTIIEAERTSSGK